MYNLIENKEKEESDHLFSLQYSQFLTWTDSFLFEDRIDLTVDFWNIGFFTHFVNVRNSSKASIYTIFFLSNFC